MRGSSCLARLNSQMSGVQVVLFCFFLGVVCNGMINGLVMGIQGVSINVYD